MKIIKNKLKNSLNIRTEKNYPVEGVEFIDITPLILQKETLKEMVDAFVNQIKDKNIDYIVAPEARGFLLGSAVAIQLNIGCVPVRKKEKLPPSVVVEQVEYEKEYGKDVLEMPKLVNDEYKNRNFYIIDDIYATGNTNKAIKEAIKKLGGNVVGEAVVMNIVGLNDNKDLFSLIDVEEEWGLIK